jgi:hypothetical protein
MNNFLRKNLVLVIILLGIVAGLFYWLQVRPYLAIKGCNQFAKDVIEAKLVDGDTYDVAYRMCLRDKGIQ